MEQASGSANSTPVKSQKRASSNDQTTPSKRRHRSPREHVTQRQNKETSEQEEEEEDGFNNLTMTNVKSIIYNVIKDADVQKMLSNTLEDDVSKLEPATYEPKMTRAKMKQVLANEGNIPYPWPLSPVKTVSNKSKKNFTDLIFPEDDDDEDYNPDKDLADLSGLCSDEDNESILSAHTSDVGSPTMCTGSPQVGNSPSLVLPVIKAKHDNLPQTISCMGPPPPIRTSKESERRFLDALDQLDLSDTIAKRTRSQQPLKHTTISSLEAEFVPPDITLDMYEDPEQEDENPDWKSFLTDLMKDDIPVEDDDDDDPDADPEYNVLAEPEVELEDDHILRTRVSKNEINLLMDELYDNESQYNDDDSQDMPTSFNMPKPLPISKLTSVSDLILAKKANNPCVTQSGKRAEKPLPAAQVPSLPVLSDYERRQLKRQIESFVQILTQQAVLSQVTAPLLYQQSTHFLDELDTFASKSIAGANSAFNACNLKMALGLIDNYKQEEEAKEGSLTTQQMSALALSPVCMYPELLPQRPFKQASSSNRVMFHHAEDVLICMGLDEFKSYKKDIANRPIADMIHEYLIPVIPANSICQRIRNETKKDKAPKTTIGRYKSKGLVPGGVELSRNSSSDGMVPPIDRIAKNLYPEWLKNATKGNFVVMPANTVTNIANMLPVSAVPSTPVARSANILVPIINITPASSVTHSDATTNLTSAAVVGVPTETSTATHCADFSVTPTAEIDSKRIETSQKSGELGILGILSDLSEMFSGREHASPEEGPSLILRTPTKKVLTPIKSPERWQKIATSTSKGPETQYIPLDPTWKMKRPSPRRKELRTKAQAIVPKSFVATVYNPSPTKKAAKAISEKALNRASQKTKYLSPLKNIISPSKTPQLIAEQQNTTKPIPAATSKKAKLKSKAEDIVDDEQFPATLIEAMSVTKARSTKKHRYMACLATDIVENDPKRIEREDIFSRWYINKVKDTLGDTSPDYSRFLEALIAFGKQRKNPAVFYDELKSSILKDRDELLEGFAAFLLPSQAVACGERSYKACVQFNQARKFLRKIEVFFGANSKSFQKLIKLLSACNPTDTEKKSSVEHLRGNVSSLLKAHPALLQEFTNFFPDAAPPKRHKDDYEVMDLTEIDEETVMDGYEEMEIPEIEETNATPHCKCPCHEEEGRAKAIRLRKMHCKNCRIAIVQGRLLIHAGPSRGLRPAYIRYLNPLPSESAIAPDSDDDDSKFSDLGYESPLPENAVSPGVLKFNSPGAGEISASIQKTTSPDSDPQHNASSTEKWTRDEDRLILEAMQEADYVSLSDDTLFSLSVRLRRRTMQQAKERCVDLLQLLSQRLGGDESDSTRSSTL